MSMIDLSPLPIAGDIPAATADALMGGQPFLVCGVDGHPAGVLIDLESWAEIEMALDDQQSL